MWVGVPTKLVADAVVVASILDNPKSPSFGWNSRFNYAMRLNIYKECNCVAYHNVRGFDVPVCYPWVMEDCENVGNTTCQINCFYGTEDHAILHLVISLLNQSVFANKMEWSRYISDTSFHLGSIPSRNSWRTNNFLKTTSLDFHWALYTIPCAPEPNSWSWLYAICDAGIKSTPWAPRRVLAEVDVVVEGDDGESGNGKGDVGKEDAGKGDDGEGDDGEGGNGGGDWTFGMKLVALATSFSSIIRTKLPGKYWRA